ncbi:cellulose synthase/poly-beta-1,6-N-acetylglucosamine synthase-like glycosyltransferase [Kineococcus xinjiangensis]|uniref:Cellulose synthase/poly-beta-1,6-N-acetylglucosamine synthase-like glycosyltransferase n=1 Tax=Kineococcus xinjiangensis TaxID=512762 RepID=A0A2S6IUQ0_9ACTN|nr:glycosyltransferase family 2 protein [Kineococcus xinjiangensis]PPK98002.1 cellulose synthase/poly-beta-1,6-N-acetylglucosamine synthase-like glycosyltransferase [Kineococcus xinjiangensis]
MTLIHEDPTRAQGLRLLPSPVDAGAVPAPHSVIAGPVVAPVQARGRFVPRWRNVPHRHGRLGRTILLAAVNITFELAFAVWLLWPSHYPQHLTDTLHLVANVLVIASIAVVETLRLVNVISLSVASVIACDPVLVEPERGTRLAFATSFVPGKEPLEMLEGTLARICEVRDPSGLGIDVWVLDEGDDEGVRRLCERLGVHHFSRHGIERYNQPSGTFKARSKHGNYNAWLDAVGYERYDVLMSVDTDHQPEPNYAERILGPFRDPDVAYVVGPQDYGNAGDGFVPMGAESQQFPFHSVIQRAANRYGAAMLVGTNNAFRLSALRSIGGLQDSVTEDMATGLEFHTRRNPATGKRWSSVYTPDVLAVGEGPMTWGDFFSQQDRWSRGTFEVLRNDMWRKAWRLPAGHLLHYALITTFYPSMAIAWLLGAVSVMLYAVLGAGGLVVPAHVWIALYVDATLFQMWIYFSNRRYNVSPFEREGSFGFSGMLMSIFATPVYAGAFLKTLLRLPAKFAVTPKGSASNADGLFAFRLHLFWMGWFAVAIVVSALNGHAAPASLLWPVMSLVILSAPILLSRREQRANRVADLREPLHSVPTLERAAS